MKKLILCALAASLGILAGPVFGQQTKWITEAEMKQLSAVARQKQVMLVSLNCKFKEGVENPGRQDVIFQANFERVLQPQAWGWTFDANAVLPGPENQAKAAGFVVAAEDYYEITGVTWVRCKVWHRPG